MSDSKLITVFGATGAQGSSVLRSLAANKTTPFMLRGITRNTSSESAKKLSASVPGVELVKADGWDKESMIAAFKGSWAVFVNTNSDDPVFEKLSAVENLGEVRTEAALGRGVVDAAGEAGVKVFVYSGMASARETTHGQFPVAAFDDKNAIGEYAKATHAFESVIIVSAGWYFESFATPDFAPVFGSMFDPSSSPSPSSSEPLIFKAPKWGGKEDVPFIAIGDDFGDIVHGALLEHEKWNGKMVLGVSTIQSFTAVSETFSTVTGKQAKYEEIPNWRDLEVFGIRALETVKLMFGFCQESGGRYFGEATENGTAGELKRKAANACGKTGAEGELLTLEKFFAKVLGGK